MDVLFPFVRDPPAGAFVHVTAGALDTVQVKFVESTVDWRIISVALPLHIVPVLLTVAPASGMAFMLNR